MVFKLKVWTGPCSVGPIAKMFRDAGIQVTCEGTEHVYVTGDGSDRLAAAWNVLVAFRKSHGTDLGLRPLVIWDAV